MRSIYTLLFIFVAALAADPASAEAPDPLELVVMTTSDLQSQVVPFSDSPGDTPVGGLSRISAAARNVSATADGFLLLSSGDDLIGPFYDLFGGEPEMTAMTMAGYDAVCPGNHEFDFGLEAYLNATVHAGFPIISSDLQADDPRFHEAVSPSTILEVAGLKVGIFGLMTPDLARLSNAGEGVLVNSSYVEVARVQVDDLRDQGADLVVLLSHMGAALDADLAGNLSGIDLIVGGHDHVYVNGTVEGPGNWSTLMVQDGMEGEKLGVLRFNYSGEGIQDPRWEPIPLGEEVGRDVAIDRYLAPFVESYDERLAREIGTSAVDLDATEDAVRKGEAPLGNLITDAWLAWFPEADIAVINGGSIRGDRIYPRGPLSYQTLNTILPFRNDVVMVTMLGSEVRQMLEVSASALGPDANTPGGGFLQVAGISFEIDMNMTPYEAVYDGRAIKELIDPGSRVSGVYTTNNGTLMPLNDTEKYHVLVNTWLAQGGDGYAVIAGIPADRKYDTTVVDIDPVAAYIKNNSPVAPERVGRIRIVNIDPRWPGKSG